METADCPHKVKIDPRVRRTRRLLEDALRALCREKSFQQISVGEIAERATVNRATFYVHFEDKRHLAQEMFRNDLEEAIVSRLDPKTPVSSESLGAVGEAVFEFVHRTIGECPKRFEELAPTFASTVQRTLEGFLDVWLAHHPESVAMFGGAERGLVSTALAMSLYGRAERWSQIRNRPPAAEAACEVVALFVRTYP